VFADPSSPLALGGPYQPPRVSHRSNRSPTVPHTVGAQLAVLASTLSFLTSDPRGFVSVGLPQLPFLVRKKKAPQRGGGEILLGRDGTRPRRPHRSKAEAEALLHRVHAAPPIRPASAEVSSLASRFAPTPTLCAEAEPRGCSIQWRRLTFGFVFTCKGLSFL
jgi:hypothetical protein